MGEKQTKPFQLSFNGSLKVDFQGSHVTSDGGLILVRELDERLGLGELIDEHLSDSRQGTNKQFTLADLLRQSIYSRLAGYEDVNDAVRVSADPTFRLIGSQKIWDRGAALTSTLHGFETEMLASEENLLGLMALNRELVGQAEAFDDSARVVLDMDSTESPVHGQQEGSAYNGLCYVFLPLYRRMGIYTLSEYLGRRYDERSRVAYAITILVFIALIHMVIAFYIGSRSMLFLLRGTPLEVSYTTGIVIFALVTACYTIVGGLKAVIWTDVIQSVLLLLAGILVALSVFAQPEIGGFTGLMAKDAALPLAEQKFDQARATCLLRIIRRLFGDMLHRIPGRADLFWLPKGSREQCRPDRRAPLNQRLERTDEPWRLPAEVMCRVQREKTWYSGQRGCILWPCQGQNGNPGLHDCRGIEGGHLDRCHSVGAFAAGRDSCSPVRLCATRNRRLHWADGERCGFTPGRTEVSPLLAAESSGDSLDGDLYGVDDPAIGGPTNSSCSARWPRALVSTVGWELSRRAT